MALILGDDEMAHDQISIKDLRSEMEQITVNQDQINQTLKNFLE